MRGYYTSKKRMDVSPDFQSHYWYDYCQNTWIVLPILECDAELAQISYFTDDNYSRLFSLNQGISTGRARACDYERDWGLFLIILQI